MQKGKSRSYKEAKQKTTDNEYPEPRELRTSGPEVMALPDVAQWSGRGLSRPMVAELRAIVITRYAQASEMFKTYVPDPDFLGGLMPPGGWKLDQTSIPSPLLN